MKLFTGLSLLESRRGRKRRWRAEENSPKNFRLGVLWEPCQLWQTQRLSIIQMPLSPTFCGRRKKVDRIGLWGRPGGRLISNQLIYSITPTFPLTANNWTSFLLTSYFFTFYVYRIQVMKLLILKYIAYPRIRIRSIWITTL